MKIEKISDDKIRIILRKEDFKDKSLNIQKLLFVTPDSQKLFLEILNKAKDEVNFDTEGHKLLIETFFQNEDSYIFTITKFLDKNSVIKNKQRTCLTVKRKKLNLDLKSCIYKFDDFEDFCSLCNFFNKNTNINIKNIFKTSILYFYKNTYYLVIDNIDPSNKFIYFFHSALLEFSNLLNYTKNFKFKLNEHAKIIIKNNAIITGIKYFSYK